MRRALAVALLALLPLAACGDDDDEPDGDATTSTTSTTAEDASTTTSTDEGGTTTTATPDAPVEATIVPGTSGIDVSAEGGEGGSFAFGSTDEVVDAVTAVLGDPTDESDIPECPAGPANGVTWDDLQLTFQEGALVGWSMDEGSTLVTADGLRIGSTLQEVRDRYPDVLVIPDSTIGIEIYVESVGLSGLVTEDSPTGTLTSLWAGTVCIFR